MAPETFDASGGQSRVFAQPQSQHALHRALMALVACPTASIGSVSKQKMAPVIDAFPDPIDGPVYHCGYHAEASFGATSYLITRASGNILVDSPRYSSQLAKRIEALGGASLMFLTHRDDVADHEKWHDKLGCERIMHADDVSSKTRSVEHQINGTDPLKFDDDITLIPVPGHTRGSACLLFRDRYLFTGDHVAYDAARSRIYAFRGACWYDWTVQTESMQRLLDHRFEWILPGHGGRGHLPGERMRAEMQQCIAWMRTR